MVNVFRLFMRSPFEPLKELLKKVDGCVAHIGPMLEANFAEDYDAVKDHFRAITAAEHEADEIKNNIRDNLPRSAFLPIDRWHFLEIISSADQIADRAEDLGYLLTIRKTRIPESLKGDFTILKDKVLETYQQLNDTVVSFDELLDSGFSGPPAERVLQGIFKVCHLEWEADKIMYKLSQHIFSLEDQLSPIDLLMINDIGRVLGTFADSVEKLAKHIRRTLST